MVTRNSDKNKPGSPTNHGKSQKHGSCPIVPPQNPEQSLLQSILNSAKLSHEGFMPKSDPNETYGKYVQKNGDTNIEKEKYMGIDYIIAVARIR